MNESNTMRQVMADLTTHVKNARVFRNNTGTGWQGDCQNLQGKIIIRNPRPLNAGLCPGSSDLIGWTSVEITPDMVGLKVAVFTALEVKARKGVTAENQKIFIRNVRAAGGFAHVVKSPEDAVGYLTQPAADQLKTLSLLANT